MYRLRPPLGEGFQTMVRKPKRPLVHIPNIPLIGVGTDKDEMSGREEVRHLRVHLMWRVRSLVCFHAINVAVSP